MLKKLKQRLRGFTLFELLLALGLVFIIGTTIIPSYHSYALNNELTISRDIVVQALNQAQGYAQSGKNGSHWGVHLANNEVIIFQGFYFFSFNPATDERFQLPSRISIAPAMDIVFSSLTGLPNWSGDIILSNTANQTITLNINEKGIVNY